MADARQASLTVMGIQSQAGPETYRQLVTPNETLFLNTGRYDADGNPASPSLRQGVRGRLTFDWPVKNGSRSFSIKVRFTPNTPNYPQVILHANPSIGVANDVIGTAVAGTAWQTIGPLAVAPTSDGVLRCSLVHRHHSMEGFVLWDNLTVT